MQRIDMYVAFRQHDANIYLSPTTRLSIQINYPYNNLLSVAAQSCMLPVFFLLSFPPLSSLPSFCLALFISAAASLDITLPVNFLSEASEYCAYLQLSGVGETALSLSYKSTRGN